MKKISQNTKMHVSYTIYWDDGKIMQCKAFLNNEDIHTLTASQVFGKEINKIDPETRRKAKSINFGIIYGISQYGLAKQINVSNNQAEEFLNSYFKKFPEIKDYMKTTINFCRKNGYVSNIFG